MTTLAEKPSSLDALRERLAQDSSRLTPRMRDAAQYALDHPNELALNPLASVASSAGIAPAAFIRMAKALGYDGFSDLQLLFREPLHLRAQPTYRERIRHYGGEETLDDPGDPAQVLGALSRANIVSLEHLQDDAANLPLAGAIQLIQQARVVHVLGLRRSYAVAAYLAYALNRIGQPAVQITGLGGTIAEQASVATEDDLLIAISFPPYAGDTLAVCEQLHRRGVKRLAITDAFLSPIARNAALVLEVNDAKLLGFRSLVSAMCVAQSLAVALAFDKRDARKNRSDRTARTGINTAAPELQEIDC